MMGLQDMLLQVASPGGTIYLSQIVKAIMNAEGVAYCDVSVPGADIELDSNQIAVLGTVTYP